jgi:hypothetical protein
MSKESYPYVCPNGSTGNPETSIGLFGLGGVRGMRAGRRQDPGDSVNPLAGRAKPLADFS